MATFSKTTAAPGITLGQFILSRQSEGDYRQATVYFDGKIVGTTPWEWRSRIFRRQLRALLHDIQRTFFPSEPRIFVPVACEVR